MITLCRTIFKVGYFPFCKNVRSYLKGLNVILNINHLYVVCEHKRRLLRAQTHSGLKKRGNPLFSKLLLYFKTSII